VTSAGMYRVTLIEDFSPGLGCRQGSRGNLSCPAVRQTEVTLSAVYRAPLPGDPGVSPFHCLRSERVRVEVVGLFGICVVIGLMRGPADKPPPAPRTPTATCRNQSPPVTRPARLTPRGLEGPVEQYGTCAEGPQEAKMVARSSHC
jgi:hypothetical protein